MSQAQATGAVASTRSYLLSGHPSLLSRERHATMVPIAVLKGSDIDPVLPLVNKASADPAFAVSITGLHTLNHDFTRLSR